MPNQPLGEEPFHNIQPEPPQLQLHAIPLGSIAGHQREEIYQNYGRNYNIYTKEGKEEHASLLFKWK